MFSMSIFFFSACCSQCVSSLAVGTHSVHGCGSNITRVEMFRKDMSEAGEVRIPVFKMMLLMLMVSLCSVYR